MLHSITIIKSPRMMLSWHLKDDSCMEFKSNVISCSMW